MSTSQNSSEAFSGLQGTWIVSGGARVPATGLTAPGVLYAWNNKMMPKRMRRRKDYVMNRLGVTHPSEEVKTYFQEFRVVVVLVEAVETEDQAWRCHVRENPEDSTADIKIFHIDTQGSP